MDAGQVSEQGKFVVGIDHVQVAMPAGGDERARAFYAGVLGLRELAKPEPLAGRGGVWFACGQQQLHLGVDPAFVAQRKGHPGLFVHDLDGLRTRLSKSGAPVIEDDLLPGYERIYTADPFGNRLELLRPLLATPPDAPPADDESGIGARPPSPVVRQSTTVDVSPSLDAEAIKERVRENFGRAAEAYVSSAGHAHGSDLRVLLEWAAPQPTDRALDVSTGGGHTALALAPHVARVTASDLTPKMLAAARRFLTSQSVTNADYVVADAERLPFLDASFDLVTVRIAPHHYADIRQAVREMARVLVPGGRLVVIDNVAPEDALLDEYMNKWEQWRDPSHVRAYRASEWQIFFAEAGLREERTQTDRKTHPFADWVERMQISVAHRAALEADMLAAPAPVREHFVVVDRAAQTPGEAPREIVSWSSDFLIVLAVKPSA